MERWVNYKDIFINLASVTALRIERLRKEDVEYAARSAEMSIKKDDKWRLSADYQFIDAFKTKPEAKRVAERIINGDFDCKK